MTPSQARTLKLWFLQYAARKIRLHPPHEAAMALKLTHSIRVSRISAAIGEEMGMAGSGLRLARTIGLLHDLARFDQLIRFGTFVDRVSVDHGALGAELLEAVPLVNALTARDRAILIHAVRHHNAAAIPQVQDPGFGFYLKLVRDADKLDIFHLLAHIWLRPGGEEPASEALQLRDAPEVSAPIRAAIAANHIAPMAAVKTRADLLLVRLAWVFDLHFDPTVRRLVRQGSVSVLAGALPESPSIRCLVTQIESHLAHRLAAAS
jgi:hypothetical protein